MSKPVICLMGPTASGKTALAMELYQQLPSRLISVDSALIYRGMDIGTAKPTAAELQLAPHELIDICDPREAYSAADFRADAIRLIDESHQQGLVPILVGGTMLYFKALLEGLSPLPSASPEIRADIEAQALLHGWAALHQQLCQFDPVSGARIHPNDPQRISRAIEVYRISGQSLTELTQQKGQAPDYQFHQFALLPTDREQLHQRIALRFENMMADSFLEEVRKLYLRQDLHLDLPSIRCVGYRQLWQHLSGELSLDEAVYRGIVATRQLAKRQFTWLRGWPDAVTLEAENKDLVAQVMRKISAC